GECENLVAEADAEDGLLVRAEEDPDLLDEWGEVLWVARAVADQDAVDGVCDLEEARVPWRANDGHAAFAKRAHDVVSGAGVAKHGPEASGALMGDWPGR